MTRLFFLCFILFFIILISFKECHYYFIFLGRGGFDGGYGGGMYGAPDPYAMYGGYGYGGGYGGYGGMYPAYGGYGGGAAGGKMMQRGGGGQRGRGGRGRSRPY
jgi:hypothetical protein